MRSVVGRRSTGPVVVLLSNSVKEQDIVRPEPFVIPPGCVQLNHAFHKCQSQGIPVLK